MPKVSVIIPIYGVEKYIDRCVRSLFEQTLDNIEYIFIDDCTPDKSIEILERMLEEYRERLDREQKSVQIVSMPTNSGLAAVRKRGIQLCKGDYIIHCDSDDWVDTDMYRTMYEHAVANNADVVICDYVETDGINYNKEYSCLSYRSKDSIIDDLIYSSDWTVWNKLVSSRIYRQTDYLFAQNNMGEDLVLTIQNMYYADKVVCIHRCFYNYFVNPDSITRDKNKEKILNSCKQCWTNLRIIEPFISSVKSKELEDSLVALKLLKKNLLLPILKDGYYDLWRDTFKEINGKVLINNHVSIKDKIKFVLTYLKLYPR